MSLMFSNPELFFLQIADQVKLVLPQLPVGLQDAVTEMVNQDTRHRPDAKSLLSMQYFK